MNGLVERKFSTPSDFLKEKGVSHLEEILWQRAFELWHMRPGISMIREEKRPRVAMSWDEWTKHYLLPLRLPELDWFYGEVEDPLGSIPFFRGGPFQSWSESFYGKNIKTFGELIEIEEVREGSSVRRHYQDPPEVITLFSIFHRGEVMVLEGMHKCLALALAKKRKEIIRIPDVYIVVGFFNDEWELPLLARSRNGMRLHHSI